MGMSPGWRKQTWLGLALNEVSGRPPAGARTGSQEEQRPPAGGNKATRSSVLGSCWEARVRMRTKRGAKAKG